MEQTTDFAGVMEEAVRLAADGDQAASFKTLWDHRVQGWSNPEYLALLGAAAVAAGQAFQAGQALNRAAAISGNTAALFARALACRTIGQEEEAVRLLLQVLQLEPAHAEARQALQEISPASVEAMPDAALAPVAGAASSPDPRAHLLAVDEDGDTPPPAHLPSAAAPVSVAPSPFASPSAASALPDGPPQGPRTPEQIAMEEWEKEEEFRRIHRQFIRSGVIYGAATGAIVFSAITAGLLLLVWIMSALQGGTGEGMLRGLMSVLLSGVEGAVFGAVVGPVVALRNGGAFEGGVTGALLPIVVIQIIRLAGSLAGAAAGFMCVGYGVAGCLAGALIGWGTAISIRD